MSVYGAETTSKTVRVGLFPLHPLNFVNEQGEAAGLYPDIIRAVAQERNWQVQFIEGTWSQNLERLQSGGIDLMTTIAFTPERAQHMDYTSEAVCDIWGQVFALPASRIEGVRDLAFKPVAIMRRDVNGANFMDLIERLGVQCEIKEYGTHVDVFTAIQRGEVIAGIVPQHFGLRNADSYGLVASTIQFAPFSVFFAVKKSTNADIIEAFDQALKHWKTDTDSLYYESLNRWMGAGEGRAFIPSWVVIAGAALMLGLSSLFIINRVLNARVQLRTAALEQRELEYRSLVENANCVILKLDATGHISYVNPYGLRLFGFQAEELLGKPVLGTIVPEQESGGRDLVEMVDDVYLKPEESAYNENENICKDGSRLFMQWSNYMQKDAAGHVIEVLAFGVDITKRRELERDLQQARKMEAIGTLAGGVAHDFNNMLSGIMSAADLLALDANARQQEYVNVIISAGERAASLIHQMLAYARKGDIDLKPIECQPLIDDTLIMLRSSLDKKIRIHAHCDDDVGYLMGNAAQLQNVLINLAINAQHAMPNGGEIRIDLDSYHVQEPGVIINGMSLDVGDYVRLSFSDTGQGIPYVIRDKIFEPFFTTKEQGAGTGLGLAAVFGIIKSHRGAICVADGVETGTTFVLYIPASTAQTTQVGVQTQTALHNHYCVLLIEDEEALRGTVRRMLEKLNCTVIEAENGAHGVELFDKHSDDIDLVLLDMIMPIMDGAETFSALRQRQADVPIILASGYSEDEKITTMRSQGLNDFMTKPYRLQELKDSLARVLEHGSTTKH